MKVPNSSNKTTARKMKAACRAHIAAHLADDSSKRPQSKLVDVPAPLHGRYIFVPNLVPAVPVWVLYGSTQDAVLDVDDAGLITFVRAFSEPTNDKANAAGVAAAE